jgi:hypothetical protein
MRSQSHIKFAKVSPFVPCVYSHNVVQVKETLSLELVLVLLL